MLTKLRSKNIRTGIQVAAIKQAFFDNLAYLQGKFPSVATKNDYYMALAYTVRDHLMKTWVHTAKTYFEQAARTVCYLSAEFLLGPQLGNNINNLGIYKNVKQAMTDIGLDLDELLNQETEPGLGNGGLGRLAACYMDSLATLDIPAIGYGIRYEFGIFNQEIIHGWQVEKTDKWLRFGNPWEIARPEISFDIKLGGRTEHDTDQEGRFRVNWIPERVVKSVAYDTPIVAYQTNTASFLRLWKAEACESFDIQAFNTGDYYGAVHEKIASENITKILYPNDEPYVGKKLRLEQQYFFVSSSLQDMIRLYLQRDKGFDRFSKKFTVQLNDTHPSLSIAELMRLLVDEYLIGWDQAWDITRHTFNYTNHTLMPEALEKWPVQLFASVLPRHWEIILEINQRFLSQMSMKFPSNMELIRNLSLIDERGERSVRMANLACVGSHCINGVSKLHSKLLKERVLHDFYTIWPEKFSNKTNGITPRRFLLLSNPRLSQLITKTIGDGWIKDLERLHALEAFANKPAFQKAWQLIKLENKNDLAKIIKAQTNISVDPNTIFDMQAKRFHEYKRQLLNILNVIAMYNHLRNNPTSNFTPRTIIFAGKAAPGYLTVKLIIKLITSVAAVVNNDPVISQQLKIIFMPNYSVKNAQNMFPAADLSEQISTAGMEASGTGNMKFALNGALTVGTWDGANIEICEEIGAENFFRFGLTAEEISSLQNKGYNPRDFIESNSDFREAIALIGSGHFSHGDTQLFSSLVDSLYHHDSYFICADFLAYMNIQKQISKEYHQQESWTKKSILTVANMGYFSSDRAIREYCKDIWNITPVRVK